MRFQGNESERKRVTLPCGLLDAIEEMYPEATSVSEAVRLAAADGVRARKKYQGHYDDGGGE